MLVNGDSKYHPLRQPTSPKFTTDQLPSTYAELMPFSSGRILALVVFAGPQPLGIVDQIVPLLRLRPARRCRQIPLPLDNCLLETVTSRINCGLEAFASRKSRHFTSAANGAVSFHLCQFVLTANDTSVTKLDQPKVCPGSFCPLTSEAKSALITTDTSVTRLNQPKVCTGSFPSLDFRGEERTQGKCQSTAVVTFPFHEFRSKGALWLNICQNQTFQIGTFPLFLFLKQKVPSGVLLINSDTSVS